MRIEYNIRFREQMTPNPELAMQAIGLTVGALACIALIAYAAEAGAILSFGSWVLSIFAI